MANKVKSNHPLNISLKEIEDSFKEISSIPEKANLVVLMIHDITGVKKKAIKQMLEAGINLTKAYEIEHNFEKNKKPKHRNILEEDYDDLDLDDDEDYDVDVKPEFPHSSKPKKQKKSFRKKARKGYDPDSEPEDDDDF